MAFLETPRFPDELAAWARGGRSFKTTKVETYGGLEFRNAAYTRRKGTWEIADALRTTNEAASYNAISLVNFLNVSIGELYGFRFKDFRDYKHNDAGGSGIFSMIDSTHFQMMKRYTLGSATYDDIVLKPVSPITVTGGTTPVVDYTTGIVTVAGGTPTAWAGEYDVPVRFDGDAPDIGLDESGALLNWQSLKLVQLKNL